MPGAEDVINYKICERCGREDDQYLDLTQRQESILRSSLDTTINLTYGGRCTPRVLPPSTDIDTSDTVNLHEALPRDVWPSTKLWLG